MKRIFAFLLFFSSLYAETCCPKGASAYPNAFCQDCGGESLYSARPCANRCGHQSWGVRCEASLLYWQAREDGLEFAAKNNLLLPAGSVPSANAAADIRSELIGMDFEWAPGIKAELGILFPNRSWEFDFRWTYHYNHTTHTAHAPVVIPPFGSPNGLFPLWLPSAALNLSAYASSAVPVTVFSKAKASWQCHLNAADFELNYQCFLSQLLSIEFIGGVKFVVIYQRYSVQYFNDFIEQLGLFGSFGGQYKSESVGTGPRIGFDTSWHLGRGWSVLANLNGTLALTQMRVRREDDDSLLNSIAADYAALNMHYQERFWVYRPILEMEIGFQWQTCYGCRNQYNFAFQASYEIQYCWEQNMFNYLVNEVYMHQVYMLQNDLQFHGANISLNFGF